MGKDTSQTIGYRYRLGVFALICQWVPDYLKQIRFRKKTGWIGNNDGSFEMDIQKRDLFGGDESEGGVDGKVRFLSGSMTQGVDSYLDGQIRQKSHLAGIANPTSAFRGVASIIFQKFLWGNNPFLGEWDVVVQRIRKTGYDGEDQWYGEKAEILNPNILGLSFSSPGEIRGNLPDDVAIDVDRLQEVGLSAITSESDMRTWFQRVVGSSGTTEPVSAEAGLDGVDGYGFQFNSGTFQSTQIFWRLRIREDIGAGSDYDDIEFRVTGEGRADGVPSRARGAVVGVLDDSEVSAGEFEYNPGSVTGQSFTYAEGQLDTGWQSYPQGQTFLSVFAGGGRGVFVRNVRLELRGTLGTAIYDMNPAHIVREQLVQKRRIPEAQIDDVSFQSVADVLHGEGFGLSFKWRGLSPEQKIAEVQRHADILHYTHRRTGLETLKAIRQDYDTLTLPTFTSVIDASVKYEIASELPNALSMRYWSWRRDGESNIFGINSAKVQVDGGINERSVDFLGVTNSNLASRVLSRELRSATTPKLLGNVVLDRSASNIHPGDAFAVVSPQHGLNGEVLRAIDVDEGNGRENRVNVSFIQDFYAMEDQQLVIVEEPADESVISDPVEPSTKIVQEAPFYEIARAIGDTDAQDVFEKNPDAGFVFAAAVAENGSQEHMRVNIDDGGGYEQIGSASYAISAETATALERDPENVSVEVVSDVDLDTITFPTYAQINDEVIVVNSLAGLTLGIGRGGLDTAIAAHPIGSKVIFTDEFGFVAETEYESGDSVDVKLVSATGGGSVPINDTSATQITMNNRAVRPYPPARLQLDGDYSPDEFIEGDVLEWAHRDRLTQTGNDVYDFTFGDIGPEAGTTYRLEVTAYSSGFPLGAAHLSKVVASPYAMTVSELESGAPPGASDYRISVTSVRDGYDSWTSPYIDVPAPNSGSGGIPNLLAVFNAKNWDQDDGNIPEQPTFASDEWPDSWQQSGGGTGFLTAYRTGLFEDQFLIDRNGAGASNFETTSNISGLSTFEFTFIRYGVTVNNGSVRLFWQESSGDNLNGSDVYGLTSESLVGDHYGLWRNSATSHRPGLRTIDGAFDDFALDYVEAFPVAPSNYNEGAPAQSGDTWGVVGGAPVEPVAENNTPPDGWVYDSASILGRRSSSGSWYMDRNGATPGAAANLRKTIAVDVGDLVVVNYKFEDIRSTDSAEVAIDDGVSVESLNSSQLVEQQVALVAQSTSVDITIRGTTLATTWVLLEYANIVVVPAVLVP